MKCRILIGLFEDVGRRSCHTVRIWSYISDTVNFAVAYPWWPNLQTVHRFTTFHDFILDCVILHSVKGLLVWPHVDVDRYLALTI